MSVALSNTVVNKIVSRFHATVPASFVSLTYRLGSSLRHNKEFGKTISSKLMEVAELGDALIIQVDSETSQ